MEFRLNRPRTPNINIPLSVSQATSLGGVVSQKSWQVEEIYTYRISSTKSFQFVKSSNENTPTRSSQENTLGEAAHNEHTTFTYIAVNRYLLPIFFPVLI